MRELYRWGKTLVVDGAGGEPASQATVRKESPMRQPVLLALAAAGLAVATMPAQAANTAQPGNRDTAQASERGRSEAGERRICVREQLGGSRMTRRVCKTQAEWEALGILERDR